MGQDIEERELPEVNASCVRVLDTWGNSGKAPIEAISSLIGINSYRYDIASNEIITMDVRPGLYIAQTNINPELVVFCVGAPGRADYGIRILLNSVSGAFSFSGTGGYINITLTEDGNAIKITSRYAPAKIGITIKRLVL